MRSNFVLGLFVFFFFFFAFHAKSGTTKKHRIILSDISYKSLSHHSIDVNKLSKSPRVERNRFDFFFRLISTE